MSDLEAVAAAIGTAAEESSSATGNPQTQQVSGAEAEAGEIEAADSSSQPTPQQPDAPSSASALPLLPQAPSVPPPSVHEQQAPEPTLEELRARAQAAMSKSKKTLSSPAAMSGASAEGAAPAEAQADSGAEQGSAAPSNGAADVGAGAANGAGDKAATPSDGEKEQQQQTGKVRSAPRQPFAWGAPATSSAPADGVLAPMPEDSRAITLRAIAAAKEAASKKLGLGPNTTLSKDPEKVRLARIEIENNRIEALLEKEAAQRRLAQPEQSPPSASPANASAAESRRGSATPGAADGGQASSSAQPRQADGGPAQQQTSAGASSASAALTSGQPSTMGAQTGDAALDASSSAAPAAGQQGQTSNGQAQPPAPAQGQVPAPGAETGNAKSTEDGGDDGSSSSSSDDSSSSSDRQSSSDDDDSDSSSELSYTNTKKLLDKMMGDDGDDEDDDEDGGGGGGGSTGKFGPTTKNETPITAAAAGQASSLPFSVVPPELLPDLKYLGTVHSIVDGTVCVVEQDLSSGGGHVAPAPQPKGVVFYPPLPEAEGIQYAPNDGPNTKREVYAVLDTSSLLCYEDGKVLGAIFETFGSVQQPFYSILLPPATQGKAKDDQPKKGSKVFYTEKHASFVLTRTLKALPKGSDASNVHDEEVGDDEREFSDDEQETLWKQQRKAERKGGKARTADQRGAGSGGQDDRSGKRQRTDARQYQPALPPRRAPLPYEDAGDGNIGAPAYARDERAPPASASNGYDSERRSSSSYANGQHASTPAEAWAGTGATSGGQRSPDDGRRDSRGGYGRAREQGPPYAGGSARDYGRERERERAPSSHAQGAYRDYPAQQQQYGSASAASYYAAPGAGGATTAGAPQANPAHTQAMFAYQMQLQMQIQQQMAAAQQAAPGGVAASTPSSQYAAAAAAAALVMQQQQQQQQMMAAQAGYGAYAWPAAAGAPAGSEQQQQQRSYDGYDQQSYAYNPRPQGSSSRGGGRGRGGGGGRGSYGGRGRGRDYSR